MRLAGARRTKGDDISEDDTPSTSGRQFLEGVDGDLLHADAPKVDDGLVPCFLFCWRFSASLQFKLVETLLILILVLIFYLLECAAYWSISPSCL